MDVVPTAGTLVLEVLSSAGEVLRRAHVAASTASESEPLRFRFAPLLEIHPRARLRVTADGLDAPVGVFEWQRRELGGLGPRRTRAFCALEFADPAVVARG